MALLKKKFSEIPTDAVILSEEDAIKYQLDLVKGWKKKNDTWIFHNGFIILSSLSALSAVYINSHYRSKFRLSNYGRMSSYLPIVALPTLVSGIFHQQFVVTDVLIAKSCPICVTVRAASFQSFLSTIFPLVLAPLAAMPFAIRYNTYNIPPITKEPKKVFQMLYKHTKPISSIVIGILAAQAVAAAVITYLEQNSVYRIQSKLDQLEQELVEQYGSLS